MGASRPADTSPERVSHEEEFLRHVRSERVRCDRSGQVFSLIELACDADSELRHPLADVIAARVRTCDRVGLLNGGQIAILLPATDRSGAERLMADVERELEAASVHATSRISSYPTGADERAEPRRRDAYSPLDEALAHLCSVSMPRWKRVMDFTGAVVGLVLFAPLFALLPLYIKVVSPGPVFFRQQRVGYRGRPFTFIKFRTMKPDNDSTPHRQHLSTLIKGDQPMTKLDAVPQRRDLRVIAGGNILRTLALDEIPQFINILRGEMSLVGPRPCIPYEAVEYRRWHTQRFDVMPGLTGLWQVSGKNKLSFADMVRLDNTYARTMSFWLDVRILLLTFPSLLVMAVEAALCKLANRNQRTEAG